MAGTQSAFLLKHPHRGKAIGPYTNDLNSDTESFVKTVATNGDDVLWNGNFVRLPPFFVLIPIVPPVYNTRSDTMTSPLTSDVIGSVRQSSPTSISCPLISTPGGHLQPCQMSSFAGPTVFRRSDMYLTGEPISGESFDVDDFRHS
jgi:hypothetical protein